jgi:hypothetical protein
MSHILKDHVMTVSWLKTGSASAQIAQQEEAAREEFKASFGKLYRFFLKPKEEGKITFVDGELNPEGFLMPPRFYEHTIQVAGKWVNYVCPEKTNPGSGEICPICKSGDRPALVSLFTIIDHRGFERKTKDGGKIWVPFSKKLLVVKTQMMEILAKKAMKNGGLSGCTFEVSRVSDKAAAIGDVYDLTEKLDAEVAFKKFMAEVTDDKGKVTKDSLFKPADYENEIVYYTAQELSQKGLGGYTPAPNYSPGGNSGAAGAKQAGSNYKDQL